MKNTIQDRIEKCNKKGKVALIAYLMGGYPTLEIFKETLLTTAKFADIIEIGLPFSDPLADGLVIQNAAYHVINQGITSSIIMDEIKKISSKIEVSLVLMTYFNTVLNFGLEKFAKMANSSGISGVIIPDMPPDEDKKWKEISKKYNLSTIFLLAPTSSDERIKLVAKESDGFIYCVSVTGVTGARDELPSDLKGFIKRVKKYTDKPVAVGFGISKPMHVKQLSKFSDAVIIGSALLKQINTNGLKNEIISNVENYLSTMKKAT